MEKYFEGLEGKISYKYNLKNANWFNIGGVVEAFFKPKNLNDLVNLIKNTKKEKKLHIIGAGSNLLISDKGINGIAIKLGSNFSNISKIDDTTLIAGASTIDRKLSEYAMENEISGFEFLSCIPGTIGGGIKMNSGCFENEFKDIIISVQALDENGKILSIPKEKIKFSYRKTSLDSNLIFLSATFKGQKGKKNKIKEKIISFKEKKNKSQPSKIKTGGSTFKNPIDQTQKKVWELIDDSVGKNVKFGDAIISKKHSNFFINEKNASFEDMNNLINFVKHEVKKKTGVNLDLEIKILK